VDRVALYALFGGVPAYWERIDPRQSVSTNIKTQLLSPNNLMQSEPADGTVTATFTGTQAGVSTVSEVDADGSGIVSLSNALAGANAQLSGSGTLAIVFHDSGLTAVPFGKGVLAPTQNACAEYYDFFVLGGSGSYTLLLPVKADACATYLEAHPWVLHFLLDGSGVTQPTCTPINTCWVSVAATYNSTNRQLSATLSVDLLHGTPFSAPNEVGQTPSVIQLLDLEARSSGPGGWIWLAPLALTLIGLWKLWRR
jgi:hypothetical protein